jgi:hypothetical protein
MGHRYTGILARPITSVEWDYFRREAIEERLNALFVDFGMEPATNPKAIFELLLKLAERHVNGFRHEGGDVPIDVVESPRRAGRPRSRERDVDLVFAFLLREKQIADGEAHQVDVAREVLRAMAKAQHKVVSDVDGKKANALLKRYKRELLKFLPDEIDALRTGIAQRHK